MDTTLFSNVNAAIPRAVWERFRFVEDIIMSEDQEWSRRVLLAGCRSHTSRMPPSGTLTTTR
jgi:hypothetical protein